ATGFVGSRVARKLVQRGEPVRCLVRKSSILRNLEGLPVETVVGDLQDAESLASAMRGCDTVYHVAADYRLWSRDPRELYRSNVDGTRNLMAAAEREGCARVVYCSTVGALGIPKDGTPGTETTPVTEQEMVGHYKRSKFQAEQEALKAAARGVPVVIVNPSTPVGPNDIKPTETGRVITRFLNDEMPAFMDTGLNLVDVDDVAEGHLLAAEKGRIGEKYILGNRDMTLQQILECLAGLTGKRAPRARIPYGFALTVASVNEFFVGALAGREPGIPVEGVRMARKKMFFDPGKAVRELGLPQTPVEEALESAIRWFNDNGYVRRRVQLVKGGALAG
ncbi:MAG TPA: hopanoid-associated sugar epimerase, partial [Armatimonadota bacterium]|nr:hopanoid-associated sugar epimerase [Armatimonadota bacterium]